MNYIKFFNDITKDDINLVGGKNCSLGQMVHDLSAQGINIPNGFAVTVEGYWLHLEQNNLIDPIKKELSKLNDESSITVLQAAANNIRNLIYDAQLPQELAIEIENGYINLSSFYNQNNIAVAIRSSATAEDLPMASFAGQQESYLNVHGLDSVLDRVKKCMASLFTERAIVYRHQKGFDHFKVGISVGIQKMVRSDKASSGVIFTLDTETGLDSIIVITSGYGLGESIVKGLVNPDEFHVFKTTLKLGYKPIVKKKIGNKETKLIYSDKENLLIEAVPVSLEDQKRYSINDSEILNLAKQATIIEDYYSQINRYWTPMDIEWAKDGNDNNLYIVQARPETVHINKRKNQTLIRYKLLNRTKVIPILSGQSIGREIVTGKARLINSIDDYKKLNQGEILVTTMTDPDWVPLMKTASAIVTNNGGRTCHAAIVSRELSIPALIGTLNGTKLIKDGQEITIDLSQGGTGYIYDGVQEFTVEKTEVAKLPESPIDLLLNISNPDSAYELSFLPTHGIGLARMEFIISVLIGIHPMAISKFDTIKDEKLKKVILQKTFAYESVKDYFIDLLACAIAQMAAAFFPKPVVMRFSDLKSNEYRNLLGGDLFEPIEENPTIGFRGTARYCNPLYRPAFELEIEAIKKARNLMGLTNIDLLIPFVRNEHEAKVTLDILENSKLIDNNQNNNIKNPKIYMMCEIPSNILLLEQFASYFDGFSLGSNDLTQLILGVDRDSAIVKNLYNETDKSVELMIIKAIQTAKKIDKPLSFCGQAASDFPQWSKFLIKEGITSLSLDPDAVIPFLLQKNS